MEEYYIARTSDGEYVLRHYGVKGMKWGVRRRLGQNARMAARIRSVRDDEQRVLDRLERRREKRIAKGKNTNRLDRRITKRSDRVNNLNKAYGIATKDLSKRDIKKGERQVNRRNLFTRAMLTNDPYDTGERFQNRRSVDAFNRRRVNRYVRKNVGR